MKDLVLEEIERHCGKVEWMPGFGHCFMLNQTLCLYMYCKNIGSMRFVIPSLLTAESDNMDEIMELVNQANREVKYIKTTILDNGCLTLTYDHKMVTGEKPEDIVPHIIKALAFASEYIKNKILCLKD